MNMSRVVILLRSTRYKKSFRESLCEVGIAWRSDYYMFFFFNIYSKNYLEFFFSSLKSNGCCLIMVAGFVGV